MAKRNPVAATKNSAAKSSAAKTGALKTGARAPRQHDKPSSRRAPQQLAFAIAAGLFAGMLVYVAYYPSDSVSIERGDGLWFTALALVTSTGLWAFTGSASGRSSRDLDRDSALPRRSAWHAWSAWIDGLAIALAAWMMVAAFGTSALSVGGGNLRQATNEAWLWIAGAAVLTASRRLFTNLDARRAALVLLVGCSVGLAVHAIYQHLVSLPRTLAEYRADPDAVLRMAGIDAPLGSPMRMVFENRLLDGGPTGTFALANSLAGVLVLGYLVAGGLMVVTVGRYRAIGKPLGGLLVVVLVTVGVIFNALFFTHSRSGILAALVGAGTLCVLTFSRRALWVAMGGFVVLVTAVMSFAVFGKEEWIAQAPSSLAFRFQYWRATWQLVLDRPLFGAGPGNFQAVYPMYREASAAESIAEPHNFFFETLASGGFIAAGLLVAVAVAIVGYRRQMLAMSGEGTGVVKTEAVNAQTGMQRL